MKFSPSPYTRRLPHFDVGQAYYHLVFRLREGYLSESEIALVKQHIEEGNKKYYRLISVQIMANHCHVVLQPAENVTLSAIIRGIKGATARKINLLRGTNGSLWSDKYFDRVIRDQNDLERTLKYLEENSVKAGITEDSWNYAGWKFEQE